jgi:hypothetical protein
VNTRHQTGISLVYYVRWFCNLTFHSFDYRYRGYASESRSARFSGPIWFEILTAVTMKNTVLWNETPFSLVDAFIFYPEDEASYSSETSVNIYQITLYRILDFKKFNQ